MATRSSGYTRRTGDRYFTPEPPVDALLEHWPGRTIKGGIWEPAAGDGRVAQWLREKTKRHVHASDIKPPPSKQRYGKVHRHDFIGASNSPMAEDRRRSKARGNGSVEDDPSEPLRHIITNPPYGHASRDAVAFIFNGLAYVQKTGGDLALLLPIAFDTRPKRKQFFDRRSCFHTKIILTERIKWRGLKHKKGVDPSQHFAWYIWRAGYAADARIIYE